MGDRLKDFAEVIGKAFRESFSKINKLYILIIPIFVGVFYQNRRGINILGMTPMGGLLNYLVEVIICCFLVQTLRSVVVYGNSGKKSVANSVGNFIQPVMHTLFYYYLINLILGWILPQRLTDIYTFAIVLFKILMSAVLEEVYISGFSGFTALKNSAKFVIDNILTYGVISFIFILLEYYIKYSFVSRGLGIGSFGIILLLTLLQLIYLLVRGHLFKNINDHPYRQRKFMRG